MGSLVPDWESGKSYPMTTGVVAPNFTLAYEPSSGFAALAFRPVTGASNQQFKMQICGEDKFGNLHCTNPAVCPDPTTPTEKQLCKSGNWGLWLESGEGCLTDVISKSTGLLDPTGKNCIPLEPAHFPMLVGIRSDHTATYLGKCPGCVPTTIEGLSYTNTYFPKPVPPAALDTIFYTDATTIPCCTGNFGDNPVCAEYASTSPNCLSILAELCTPKFDQPACTAWIDNLKETLTNDPSHAAAKQFGAVLAARIKSHPYKYENPDIVYPFIGKYCNTSWMKAACDEMHDDLCADYNKNDLVDAPATESTLWPSCGCHLPADRYDAHMPQACDPICSYDITVPNSLVPACSSGTCYMDGTTEVILRRLPSGKASMSTLCSACADGECETCHMNKDAVPGILKVAEGKVDFPTACGTCYSYNGATGDEIHVSCKDFTTVVKPPPPPPPPPPSPHHPVSPRSSNEAWYDKYKWVLIGGGGTLLLMLLIIVFVARRKRK